MPLFSKRFKARAPDYGSEFELFTAQMLTIAGTATSTFGLGNLSDVVDTDKVKKHVGYVDELFIGLVVAGAFVGAATLNIKKRDSAAGATRTLVSGYSINALLGLQGKRIPYDVGVTDKDRTMQAGDFLYAEVVNTAATTTQPIGLVLNALIALLT